MSLFSDEARCCRFRGDTDLLAALRADADISSQLDDASSLSRRNATRSKLLSQAVRADKRMLPGIARSLEKLVERAGLDAPMEAYVFQEPSINAFVTRGRVHLLVGISSGAVNVLTEPELEFVIGHELGHAFFGHVDVGVTPLLQAGTLSPRACMKLLAWQRAAEISADRAGLVGCNSLEVAATALYKTLSGLDLEGMTIDPKEFAGQWEFLEQEVIEGGESDHWQLSHPFPPLRMKAMMVYAESGLLTETDADRAATQCRDVDRKVARFLAMMDPLARESEDAADPILADFFLWGGLYLALSNGELHETEVIQLGTITSRRSLDEALASGTPTSEDCLVQFDGCISRRRKKLKALEIHRILQGLLQVAAADGAIDDLEKEALGKLGGELGIGASACELIISEYQQGG